MRNILKIKTELRFLYISWLNTDCVLISIVLSNEIILMTFMLLSREFGCAGTLVWKGKVLWGMKDKWEKALITENLNTPNIIIKGSNKKQVLGESIWIWTLLRCKNYFELKFFLSCFLMSLLCTRSRLKVGKQLFIGRYDTTCNCNMIEI